MPHLQAPCSDILPYTDTDSAHLFHEMPCPFYCVLYVLHFEFPFVPKNLYRVPIKIEGSRAPDFSNTMTYTAWSTAYSNEPVEANRCYVSLAEWRRIHDDQPNVRRIFGRIAVGDATAFCALGEPKGMEEFADELRSIIIPDWVREILYLEGSGDAVEITWMSEDSFPNAIRVVLRPHDSAFYHGDAREELERALTNYGVIAQGTTIPIELEALGGFSVKMDIIQTEPANIILLEGDEIAFEFEGSLDSDDGGKAAAEAAEASRAEAYKRWEEREEAEAAQALAEALAQEQLLPTVPPLEPVGQVLGGTNRPPLPDGRPWNPWR